MAPGNITRPVASSVSRAPAALPGERTPAILPFATAISAGTPSVPGKTAEPPRIRRSYAIRSGALARRIGGRQSAQPFDRLVGRHHVGVLLAHIEQIDGVRDGAAVVDAVVRHQAAEI